VEDYEKETLEKAGVLEADILMFMTGNEALNAALARWAKEHGAKRVIARIESPEIAEEIKAANIEDFSTLLSTKALLRALIESPNLWKFLTDKDSSLHEIQMQNRKFEGIRLRHFPFTGDVIFVRIFRGKDSIVPHGDTELHVNDRLIVTGSETYVEELRQQIAY
jgi:CPA2 family monovalent cation:H+ antiporter-2